MALVFNTEKHLKVELWTDKKIKHVTHNAKVCDEEGSPNKRPRLSHRSSAPASPQRVFPKATHYSRIQFFPF